MGIRINTLLQDNVWGSGKTAEKMAPREERHWVWGLPTQISDAHLWQGDKGSCPCRTPVGLENEDVHLRSSSFVRTPCGPHQFWCSLGMEGVRRVTGMKVQAWCLLSWLRSNKTAIFLEHLSLWTEIHSCYTRINSWLIDLRGKYRSFTAKANVWVSPNKSRNCV